MTELKPVHLFASPIYITEKPEWVKPLIKKTDSYIVAAKKRNKGLIKKFKSDFGFSHHSTTLLTDPAFDEFQKFVGQGAANILDSQGFDLTNYTMVFTELWVQEFSEKGGGHHVVHTHYNNHISGFYFLKASKNTSRPFFDDPRAAALMSKLPEKKQEQSSLASSTINFPATPGKFMFFNSYMPHGFHIDRGIDPFRFIHWNMQAIPNNFLQNKIEKV